MVILSELDSISSLKGENGNKGISLLRTDFGESLTLHWSILWIYLFLAFLSFDQDYCDARQEPLHERTEEGDEVK